VKERRGREKKKAQRRTIRCNLARFMEDRYAHHPLIRQEGEKEKRLPPGEEIKTSLK